MFKKIKGRALILFLIVLLSLSTIVLAQNEAKLLSVKAGMTPDNPLYFLDRWGDGLKVVFAKMSGNEVGARLALSQEKLLEQEAMIVKGNERAAAVASRERSWHLEHAIEIAPDSSTVKSAVIQQLAVLERVRDSIANDGKPSNDNALKGLDVAINASQKRSKSMGEREAAQLARLKEITGE